jgi:aminopeptidase N
MAHRRTRRTRRLFAAVAAGLVLVLAVTTPASAGPVGFAPGAPGVGDPYYPNYGNGGYDVAHYNLDVRYDPATNELTGHASIVARATQNLSRFNLDLVGLTVDSIKVNGRTARWTRDDHELTVVPAHGLRKGTPILLDVRYHGVPVTFVIAGTTLEAGFIHTDDGNVVAGQPEVAAAWFPVNDHPQDKATYTFQITVPQGLTAIANGIPLGSSTRGGWTTWRWAELVPMISYLATATVGEWRISRSVHKGRPVYIAVDPDLPPDLADDAVGRTSEVTDFMEGLFGPYPFKAEGAIVDDYDNLAFALENQSRPIYSKFFFEPGATLAETGVVAHEIAHMWFGDSVAVHEWKDIWLNEGYATYAQWLWSDHIGDGTVEDTFAFFYNLPETSSVWQPPPGDPGVDNLFGNSVYFRGAMTLHALRLTIGDSKFFTLARAWATKKRGGNGSTPEFIALAERVAQMDLSAFFDAWLFQPPKPALPGSAAQSASAARSAAATPSWLTTNPPHRATRG